MNTNTIVMSQENISRPDDFSCSTNNDFPKEKAVSLFAHERHAMYDEQMMNMLYQRKPSERNIEILFCRGSNETCEAEKTTLTRYNF